MANEKIRKQIQINGLRYWEVAEKAGYSASHFSVKLRKPLDSETESRIKKAIDELKAKNNG